MEQLCSFPIEVQSARRQSEVVPCKQPNQEAKVKESERKVQVLPENAGKVGDLRKQLSAKEARLLSSMSELAVKEASLKAKK